MRTYLHHEDDGVECDQSHDAVLKGRRYHERPHAELETQLVLGHVSRQGPGVDGKVYTGSLEGREPGRDQRYVMNMNMNMDDGTLYL